MSKRGKQRDADPDRLPYVAPYVAAPTFALYQGFDPVQGPPNVPDHYAAAAQAGQPRWIWSVPAILIEGDVTTIGGLFVDVTITNYEWPAWSGATTYIQNQRASHGGVAYYSLVDNNLNHQPDVSPSHWAADTTTFHLFVKGGISNDTGDPLYPDWTDVDSQSAPTVVTELAFGLENLPRPDCVFYLYISATSGGATVFSNTFTFTYIP